MMDDSDVTRENGIIALAGTSLACLHEVLCQKVAEEIKGLPYIDTSLAHL